VTTISKASYRQLLDADASPEEAVIAYHERTKHYFHRYAASLGFEDRKVILGHKSNHVTTHYSAPEIGALIAAAERVCELGSRNSHALSLVRAQQAGASN
jgi:hypothetical protein